jgi:ATP-dependent DNA helicase RecG
MSDLLYKVFVSSMQAELINERTAISELVHSDPFLLKYIEVIRFEECPATTLPAEHAYLKYLDDCKAYIIILGNEYGNVGTDGLSAVHREYRRAVDNKIPVLAFVRGQSGQDMKRSPKLQELFQIICDNRKGHTYRRFNDYRHLKQHVNDALLAFLEKEGITPEAEEKKEATTTIQAASEFDTQLLRQATYNDLNEDILRRFYAAILPDEQFNHEKCRRSLLNRGLLWYEQENDTYRPTAAGLMVFGSEPDIPFPQCRLCARAYSGNDKSDPIDELDTRRNLRKALPWAIEDAFKFLVRNTKHLTRVDGLTRVSIDEYPHDALREALVNAVAHRDYALTGVCIRIEKFNDRIVILSPGAPPKPVSMQKIRALTYTPCSRNPNIARTLSYFEHIEEQGDGIRRIIDESKNHGLADVRFEMTQGYFTVIFSSPKKPLSKLRPKTPRALYSLQPADQDRLNKNQKRIIKCLLGKPEGTVPEIAKALKVTHQAIRKDMAVLQKLGLIEKQGAARATYYVLKKTGGTA